MIVHRLPSIDVEPITTLSPWRVIKTSKGDRHFIGWDGFEGRVSSPVVAWNPLTRTGTTRSGRQYVIPLLGVGIDRDAEYVFERWCCYNDIDILATTDITIQYATTTLNKGDLPA